MNKIVMLGAMVIDATEGIVERRKAIYVSENLAVDNGFEYVGTLKFTTDAGFEVIDKKIEKGIPGVEKDDQWTFFIKDAKHLTNFKMLAEQLVEVI